MPSGDVKELWLQGCHNWFLNGDVTNEKYSASAIVHTGSNPTFVVFSYDYIIGDQNAVKPNLTAYISEMKVITGKFPWEAVGELFTELMCVIEYAEDKDMIPEDVEFKTAAFLDQPLSSFSYISSNSHSMIKIFNLISPEILENE